ncbi:hypothetical protein BCV70DRAFT_126645 [Testicularia cyperi]|uniref:Uncharacterized protein n=1 Tax=Testicularia cyperi TaxID=1882483 RepID=A0A317XMD3_9BASI|nr:hypothetical protein BCV70DRAFT_126645 [Testicularia cyperi]
MRQGVISNHPRKKHSMKQTTFTNSLTPLPSNCSCLSVPTLPDTCTCTLRTSPRPTRACSHSSNSTA